MTFRNKNTFKVYRFDEVEENHYKINTYYDVIIENSTLHWVNCREKQLDWVCEICFNTKQVMRWLCQKLIWLRNIGKIHLCIQQSYEEIDSDEID